MPAAHRLAGEGGVSLASGSRLPWHKRLELLRLRLSFFASIQREAASMVARSVVSGSR